MILINVGSGGYSAPPEVRGDMQEITVDVTPPADVIADARHLPFDDDYADALYSSHMIEHFAEWELIPMVTEWRRVLKTGGTLHVNCPDIQSAAAFIAEHGIDAVAYTTDEGIQIRGQDLIHGYGQFIIEQGEPMRHKASLDVHKLAYVLHEAGFNNGTVTQRPGWYSLSATATK